MSQDCIFCKIATGKLSAELVLEEEELLAFKDINPQAPEHIVVIPRKHIPRVSDLETQDVPLMGKLVLAAKKIARERGLKDGYRLVVNCNSGAGQTVFHIHMHLLGGRNLGWPPG